MGKYHAKKYGHLDGNHKQIADALRRAGYSVGETSACQNLTDLIVTGGNNSTCLMEIKTEDKDAKFYISQIEFIARWKGYVVFVTSQEQALSVMRSLDLYALTAKQKQRLLQFATRKRIDSKSKNPTVLVSIIEELLEV